MVSAQSGTFLTLDDGTLLKVAGLPEFEYSLQYETATIKRLTPQRLRTLSYEEILNRGVPRVEVRQIFTEDGVECVVFTEYPAGTAYVRPMADLRDTWSHLPMSQWPREIYAVFMGRIAEKPARTS